jgi:hypothetical protein
MKNITESCMNDTLLTIEQDEKQFSIFSTISTIISINHTKLLQSTKLQERLCYYTAELQITMNLLIMK